MGGEERRQRHRRPHRQHAAGRARCLRGRGAERSRHLPVPRAAGDLRGPGDQPQGHRPGGRPRRSGRWAARASCRPTTRRRRSTSRSPTTTSPTRSSGGTTSGAASARRRRRWEHVRKAAPKLKNAGHPIGIGMSNELDSNMANIAFMMCFGSFIQNEENQPHDQVEADGRRAEVHGLDLQDRRDRRDLRLEPVLEQQLPLLGEGLDDPQRDLGDANARGPEPAVRRRPLDLADPGGAARAARPRARNGLSTSIWKFAKNKPAA